MKVEQYSCVRNAGEPQMQREIGARERDRELSASEQGRRESEQASQRATETLCALQCADCKALKSAPTLSLSGFKTQLRPEVES
eukprot:3155288-Rhodomonas_salina.1